MNSPTLANTNKKATVTAARGTNAPCPTEPRTARCTTMAYTNVATKTPRENWINRSRRKVRNTRDDSCPLVSCRAAMVMENTRPVKEIIAWVIDDKKLRAPEGGPGYR